MVEASRLIVAGLALGLSTGAAPASGPPLLFGVAYYDEYAPYDRLTEDVRMMRAAHINVVRIADSTWGTMETAPGVFDFRHVDRVLDAMEAAGIKVIVATPTYAIPTWLAREHPDVLVETSKGRARFGERQNMDIGNPAYRAAAERIVRALIGHVRDRPCVIGYQLDNETKAYGVSGPATQAGFVEMLKRRFGGPDAMNAAFGLDYWSNRVSRWEDFPDVNGTVNASISGAFAEYQRGMVTEFLAWQAAIARGIKRPDQFLTQNFDLAWGPAYSHGIQPEVDQYAAARALDVAGIDIYFHTQDRLTGTEIALGTDLARGMKGGAPFLVLETEAQGLPNMTPYPGQLRLQAWSLVAGGARMVEYWHWAATANSAETYWRGLLGQDFAPNPTYDEAATVGAEFERLGPLLAGARKENRIAVYFSNRALTAFDAFGKPDDYNAVFRAWYDTLYRMNAEVDLIDPSVEDLSRYRLVVVPTLYAASDAELARLTDYARAGGHVVFGMKSGWADENVKVRSTAQPGGISGAAGVRYSRYTVPDHVGIAGAEGEVAAWMEFLEPTTATALLRYDHPVWGRYAAATRNAWGSGTVTYVGTMLPAPTLAALLRDEVGRAGTETPAMAASWPVIERGAVMPDGRRLHFLFNYSARPTSAPYGFGDGRDLLGGAAVARGGTVPLGPWDVGIIEEAAVPE